MPLLLHLLRAAQVEHIQQTLQIAIDKLPDRAFIVIDVPTHHLAPNPRSMTTTPSDYQPCQWCGDTHANATRSPAGSTSEQQHDQERKPMTYSYSAIPGLRFRLVSERDCQWCDQPGTYELSAQVTNRQTEAEYEVEFWACDECAVRLLRRRHVHIPSRDCMCKECVAAEFEKWERTIITRKEDA